MLRVLNAQRWLLLPLACLISVSVWGAGFIVDGDGDGVPFEIDECPYTRAGQPVNLLGCSDLPDADDDGIPDVDDRCPVSPPGARTDSEGCSIDSDGDGVPDGVDRCPRTDISTVPDATGCSAPQRLAGGSPQVIVGRPVQGAPVDAPSATLLAAQASLPAATRPVRGAATGSSDPRGADAVAERESLGTPDRSNPQVAARSARSGASVAQQRRTEPATREATVAGRSISMQAAIDRALWGYEVEFAAKSR